MPDVEVKTKPSNELVSLFEQGANALISLAEIWSKIQTKGQEEGFSKEQLQDMFKPYLRRLGKNRHQIRYLFNMEEMKANSKEQYYNLRNISQSDIIAEREEEIRSLKLQLEEALQQKNKNKGPESISQLSRIEEKIRCYEQDLVEHHKDYVEGSQKKAVIVTELASDMEIKYTIQHKPLDTICMDILVWLKSKGLSDGAETFVYDSLPNKYKNLTKQEFISKAYF